jgi:hypothetical protein
VRRHRELNRWVLKKTASQVLSAGRWGNADLFCCRLAGRTWVVKDFSACPPLVAKTWGRWMARREYRALNRLQGIDGIPQHPVVVDAEALAYLYFPGKTLRHVRAGELPDDFFVRLEQLVSQMHQRSMVHLDMRNQRNILLCADGRPALLDFQSSLDLRSLPPGLCRLLKQIDFSGVYKTWRKLRPDLMDAQRLAKLRAIERKHFLWVLRGYPLAHRKKHHS